MKIVGITLLRNEEDIVEAFARYHCSVFDHLVIIDHASTDTTSAILERLAEEGLPITVKKETRFAHKQAEILTKALHDSALRYGADVVVPLDADEFLFTTNGESVRSVLETVSTDVIHAIAPRLYVPLPTDDKHERNPFMRITTYIDQPDDITTLCIPARFALEPRVTLEQGNHGAYYLKGEHREALPIQKQQHLYAAHFPYRTVEQTYNKILGGYPRSAAQYGLESDKAIHWKKVYQALTEGKTLHYEDLSTLALEYPAQSKQCELQREPFTLPREVSQRVQWKEKIDHTAPLLARTVQDAAEHIHALESAINTQRKEITQTQFDLQAVLSSKSWKFTAPIRNIQKWFTTRKGRKPTKGIAVVIPIHNAYADTVRCLESVILCTNPATKIVLIDDCSTDKRIGEFLADLVAEYPHWFTVLRNETQRGFVQTANRGMQCFPDDDVILLNSDTMVSPGWVERLVSIAKRNGDAASVTALSNTASIYSVLQDYIPENPSIDCIAIIASQVTNANSKKGYRIPTGVGFCLYMNRDAINDTGYFDEAFGIGYGEENDWCMRAADAGWSHYLADDCFIYHKGSASMQEANIVTNGQTTLQKHEELLRQKHPGYTKKIQRFLSYSRALGKIQSRMIGIHIPVARQSIAYLLHADIESGHKGGTEKHVYDLVTHMRKQRDCYVLVPMEDALRISLYAEHHVVHFAIPYGVTGIQGALMRFLNMFTVNLVHIHHVLTCGFSCIELLKAHGCTVVYSVHDSFATHREPQPLLHRKEGNNLLRPAHERKRIRYMLSLCDALVAPSSTALQQLHEHLGATNVEERVLTHGIDSTSTPKSGLPEPSVCFVGRVHALQKGHPLVTAVAMRLVEKGIHVHFLGSSWKDFPVLAFRKGITLHGKYAPGTAVARLQKINPSVGCVLSLFPETFCFAVEEILAAGIPAYVTPIGALPERIQYVRAGKVAPNFNPDDIARDLVSYLHSHTINVHRSYAQSYTPKNTKQMATEYGSLYREVLCNKSRVLQFPLLHLADSIT